VLERKEQERKELERKEQERKAQERKEQEEKKRERKEQEKKENISKLKNRRELNGSSVSDAQNNDQINGNIIFEIKFNTIELVYIDWKCSYAALLHYRNKYGTCNVPASLIYECLLPGVGPDGKDFRYKGCLGAWLNSQRFLKSNLNSKPRASYECETMLQKLVDEGIVNAIVSFHYNSNDLVD
jgi:flagellar biosynthesis GTPase FlhF